MTMRLGYARTISAIASISAKVNTWNNTRNVVRGECEYMEWNITSKVVREVVWVKSVLKGVKDRLHLSQLHTLGVRERVYDITCEWLCEKVSTVVV